MASSSDSWHAEHGEATSAGHHKVVHWHVYAVILVALLILTVITVWVAAYDLGPWNTPIALAIAVLKGTLVLLFFMNVRNSTPLLRIAVAAGFIWFAILIAFTMSDFVSRDWAGAAEPRGLPPGEGVGEPVEGEQNVPGIPATSPTSPPQLPTAQPDH